MKHPYRRSVLEPAGRVGAVPGGTRQTGGSTLGWLLALALLTTGILLTVDPFGWLGIPHPAALGNPSSLGTEAVTAPATGPAAGSGQITHDAHTPGHGREGRWGVSTPGGWRQIGSPAAGASRGTAPSKAPAGTPPADTGTEPGTATGVGPHEPTPLQEPPSLAGRVLDGEGYPVIGIAVRARGERFFGPVTPDARAEGSGFTGGAGQYAIGALADGQYRVSAEAAGYARAETTARTGAWDVDLVLQAEKTIVVYGRVATRGGAPLAGAQVIPNLSPAIATPTDAQGNYQASVKLNAQLSRFDVRFEHPQHVPQTIPLDETAWWATGSVELNLALEPLTATTTVQGIVESTKGEGIAGETVILYSASLMQRFEAVTRWSGAFQFPAVATAPDYMVSVRPVGPYRDYTRRDVKIMAPTALLIRLEALEEGMVFGRMTDVWGNPVPYVTLTLRSTTAASRSQRVTGNEAGEYIAYDVPTGSLVFQSDSSPFYRITAVKRGVENEEMPIVLDSGPYELRGRVLDEMGFPLLAPDVYLTWSHTQDGVRSTALRRTAGDAEGHFRFQRLGAGPHQVTVNVPGYRTGRLDQNIGTSGREIVVQLEPETL